mgnify:FL=1
MHRLHDTAEALQEHRGPDTTAHSTAVGIDVGGTKIAAGLVAEGTITRRHREATPSDPDLLLDAIVAAATSVMPATGATAVGVGYPGMVTAEGVIAAGPNVALKSFPLASALAERIGVPFDDFIKFSAEQIPVARVGQPEDIAACRKKLLSYFKCNEAADRHRNE